MNQGNSNISEQSAVVPGEIAHLPYIDLSDWGKDAISHTKENARELTLKAFHYGLLEEGAEKIGMIAQNSQAAEHGLDAKQHKSNKKRHEWYWKLLVQKALADAQKLVDHCYERWQQAKTELKVIQNELKDVREDLAYLEKSRKSYEVSCEFELNEYGELKDPKLESLVQEHEKKHGKKIDRQDFDTVYDILFLQVYQAKCAERDMLETAETAKKDEVQSRKQEYDEAIQIHKDIRFGDEATQKQAVQKVLAMGIHAGDSLIAETNPNQLNESQSKEISDSIGLSEDKLADYSSAAWGNVPQINADFEAAAQKNPVATDPDASIQNEKINENTLIATPKL